MKPKLQHKKKTPDQKLPTQFQASLLSPYSEKGRRSNFSRVSFDILTE